jgi:hypothetical protein
VGAQHNLYIPTSPQIRCTNLKIHPKKVKTPVIDGGVIIIIKEINCIMSVILHSS